MASLDYIEPGQAVLYEKRGEVVIITLNRPDSLNAINRQLRREFGGAIQRFDREEDSRVAIITGAGRAFCAGRDLKERAEDNAAGIQAKVTDSMSPESPYMWPHQTWKPLIAAINGYALAGGWAIAQMCDIRPGSRRRPSGNHRAPSRTPASLCRHIAQTDPHGGGDGADAHRGANHGPEGL